MKKILLLGVVTVSLLLSGCVHIIPAGGGDTGETSSLTGQPSAVTDGAFTEKETETFAPATEATDEFPNVPDDSHTKYY